MTGLWQFLRACWRFWPVVLVGAVATAVAGYGAIRADGVYFARTELAFLAPQSAANPNALRTQSDSIIITAGAVAREMTGPAGLPKFGSTEVTLAGAGIRDGWSLRLPDTGGQWATNFASQRLVLDVVGPTAEVVAARQRHLVDEAVLTLEALQVSQGAAPQERITLLPMPESPVISHVTGSRPRALGMIAALGTSATVACVLLLERRRRGRGALAAAAGAPPAPDVPSPAAAAGSVR